MNNVYENMKSYVIEKLVMKLILIWNMYGIIEKLIIIYFGII